MKCLKEMKRCWLNYELKIPEELERDRESDREREIPREIWRDQDRERNGVREV